MSAPVPVVFDTDIGTNVDDALALALALASPEIDLRGVMVGNGDAATLELRARIAARLLGLAGRTDVPVFLGHPQRLSESDRYPHLGHEGEGLLDHAYEGADAPVSDTPAAEWLTEQSRQERLHVVATGPFTTVAVALQRDPQLARRLRHLSVMGGFVHAGNASPYWQEAQRNGTARGEDLDYNTACDPLAALICATSGVPMTWVTIEVTLQTAMTQTALRRIRDAGTPFLDALARLTETWSARFFRHREHGLPDAVACYHDPLAMASVFGGPWLTLRAEDLAYTVEAGRFRARPAGGGGTPPGGSHRAAVSVAADSPGFEAMYLERVLGAWHGA